MKQERIDIVKLCFAKALVIGNKPVIVSMENFNQVIDGGHNIQLEKFGLFDSSTPNYTTYYPDVKAEDLVPKEGEIYYPVVRALSEVIVHKKTGNPIDFGINNALKASMNKLIGQTVNADHETALGNAMGVIRDVAWQNSYEVNGITIPGGINAELAIDGKSNPRIVRLMQMKPPGIHSVSVSVQFAWEKSHPNMPDDEFFSKLGTYDDKKQMIKRNVSKVIKYTEISLVAHGADPYAQVLDQSGKIVDPKYANITYNSEQEKKIIGNNYFFDLSSDFIKNTTIPEQTIIIQPTQTTVMKETIVLLRALATAAGVTITLADDATAIPADINTSLTGAITKLKTDAGAAAITASELAAEKGKVATLTQEVTTLKAAATTPPDVVALKAFETKQITSLRDEVERKYKLLNPTPAQTVLDSIKNSNYDALVVLNAGYDTQLEEKMPLTCSKCKSTNVTRASARAKDPNKENEPAEHVELSNEDTVRNLSKTPKVASMLHGVKEETK